MITDVEIPAPVFGIPLCVLGEESKQVVVTVWQKEVD
jgi:hypothetical protein